MASTPSQSLSGLLEWEMWVREPLMGRIYVIKIRRLTSNFDVGHQNSLEIAILLPKMGYYDHISFIMIISKVKIDHIMPLRLFMTITDQSK